jgi:hypothetical protein
MINEAIQATPSWIEIAGAIYVAGIILIFGISIAQQIKKDR